MNKKIGLVLFALAFVVLVIAVAMVFLSGQQGDQPLAAQDSPADGEAQITQHTMVRWYTAEQVQRGEPLYQTHCAGCHQPDASGTPNWKQPGPDGTYPPPPLNGSAHTWHHPLAQLRRTVQRGGVPLGGVMPGFQDKLEPHQIDDILAWIQSHWDDRIYGIWSQRDAQSRNG